jgi:S-adenosylmethionine synthetase
MTHVGTLYNLAAARRAEALVAELAELREAQCYLVSQIGRPIGDPQLVDVRLRCAERRGLERLEPRVIEVVHAHLAGVSELWRELVSGELALDRAGTRAGGAVGEPIGWGAGSAQAFRSSS